MAGDDATATGFAASYDEAAAAAVGAFGELGIGAVVSGARTFLTAGAAAPAAGGAGADRVAVASKDCAASSSRSAYSPAAPPPPSDQSAPHCATPVPTSRGCPRRGPSVAARTSGRSSRGALRGCSHATRALGSVTRLPGTSASRRPGSTHGCWLTRQPGTPRRSRTRAVAERAVFAVLRKRRFEIEKWLDGSTGQLVLNERHRDVLGIAVDRAGRVLETRGVRVVLARRADVAEGFIIRTSYPTPSVVT